MSATKRFLPLHCLSYKSVLNDNNDSRIRTIDFYGIVDFVIRGVWRMVFLLFIDSVDEAFLSVYFSFSGAAIRIRKFDELAPLGEHLDELSCAL